MEASTLSHAARRGLLTRKSPLLKLKGDEQLVALVRSGNSGAFDIIVDRYQARLLGFCRQMIGSTEDAEDVLQEVFVNAYKAMIADNREINLRPWLYRIARNRSLNHLRKPKADAQESMDMVPMTAEGGTAEKVHNREEFRQLLKDVTKLPETQRAALLLREIDALSYEEIAEAMDTTVPSVKSLLVRARISLAEASQARMLTCGEVRVELAEAAEGLAKASGPVRRHVRDCEQCADFRKQLRSDTKVLAMMFPVGGILALKAAIGAKLGFGSGAGAGAGAGAAGTAGAGAGAGAGAAGTAAGVGAAGAGAGAAGAGAGAAAGVSAIGAGAASGLGAVGSAVGAKALAGVVTAAVITAGAVEVKKNVTANPVNEGVTQQSKTIAMAPPVHAQPEVHPAPVQVADPNAEKAGVEEVPPPVETIPQEAPPATVPVSNGGTEGATSHPSITEEPVATEACNGHVVDGMCVEKPDLDSPQADPSIPVTAGEIETGAQTPVKPVKPAQPVPPVVTPSNPAPAPNPQPLPPTSSQGQAPPSVPQGQ
ncbi:MAG TPA: sigma-70 family RNA polymerase sigma factor [Solirubrobacterales bacterium]|nr:sigma-70 family RNA polymerase sigma factor [Solirubrobacterales bacterium]